MSIFNETEEEKNYKKLVKAIRNSGDLPSEWKEYLVNYVDKVYAGETENAFLEFDYLHRFVMALTEWKNFTSRDVGESMRNVLVMLKMMFPLGKSTEDYQAMMEMFLNNFCGEDGFISKGLTNEKFYAVIQNRYDYLYIMNIISHDEMLTSNFAIIADYAVDVSPYCSNQTILKNEILAFLNGLGRQYGDVQRYAAEMLYEAKKRCGIYPIDEKTLANITREAEKAQGLVSKLDAMEKRVDGYQNRIDVTTKNGKAEMNRVIKDGKNDILSLKGEILTEMNVLLREAKESILEELDRYILSLKEELKQNSNQVFNSILSETSEKLHEIRLSAQSLSQTTTSELLRIQKATEDSVSKLRAYVDDEPQLQEFLKSASEDEKIREVLLKLKAQEESLGNLGGSRVVSGPANIVIPGYDRVVTPANPSVVIPSGEVPRTVLPAFDESVPFAKRFERILQIKEREQANGEIFHELIDDVIRCVIEGDWVYLWGPSGCGKSYSIKQVARLIGLDMLDNGKITDKYSIMAYNDPQGRFRATQAFVALVYGKLLLLDEFDNGNPDTQIVLNELYSGLLDALEKPDRLRYVTFAEDMRVPIHPNFRMISAGNTSGEGENQAFSSRGKIDESVQQRMTPKRFWYDNRVEERIFGNYRDWYSVFVNFRKVCDDYAKVQGLDAPLGVVTTRDASSIVKYIRHNSKGIDQVLDEKFVQTKSIDYLKFISKEFKKIYGLSTVSENSNLPKKLDGIGEVEIAKRLVLRCGKAR